MKPICLHYTSREHECDERADTRNRAGWGGKTRELSGDAIYTAHFLAIPLYVLKGEVLSWRSHCHRPLMVQTTSNKQGAHQFSFKMPGAK